ncbi:Ig-like domain-containing protein [Cellulophaga sp. L1A9]|uniref:Ig-like domain-containing protein n=1 Tax=Cellulophaga sp. L1A9 TaxID=2686362 RepID=UPI00131D444A|nr:Ig-like domain-containing protein [Cellulophaga sp. L1A9]
MILNLNPRLANLLVTGVVLSTMLLACSNDTDNLLAQVVDDSSEINIIVDDNFSVVPGAVEALDVLENDTFSDMEAVSITQVSQPSNGNVTVNEDNTIEYSAPESSSEISDTFTYTTQSKNTAGKLTSNTGNVTIIITQDTESKQSDNLNYLFTDTAKNILKERFESDYTTGTGFTSDFVRAKLGVATFTANPSLGRPTYGQSPNISSERQIIYYAALKAYVFEDVSLANLVATEFLAEVNTNDLSDIWWSTNPNFGVDSDLWLQSASMLKMMKSYHLIKNIQTTLSDTDKSTIETFINKYAAYAKNWVDFYYDQYFGSGWELNGVSNFGNGALATEIDSQTAYPIEDSEGNKLTEYAVSGRQNVFNNRNIETVNFLHGWAISNNDVEAELTTRQFFKIVIKYGLWSNGTFFETMRNKNDYNINGLGVLYSFSTLSAMVHIAHRDAMANNYPNDKLYDYETTEGIVQGSTNLTSSQYLGGSTTDGITKKSLKTFIKGQSNYYRNTANGGWNDVRYYNGRPIDMTGTCERDYSVPQAIANIYYKDNDIKDFYIYNNSIGYPAKNSYMDGSYFGSDGNIGTSLLGGAWFEQENNFFN